MTAAVRVFTATPFTALTGDGDGGVRELIAALTVLAEKGERPCVIRVAPCDQAALVRAVLYPCVPGASDRVSGYFFRDVIIPVEESSDADAGSFIIGCDGAFTFAPDSQS
jgi:hypothetical protein